MTDKSSNEKFIEVKGAREHNLKNVSLRIPRDQLVVFTGVSGSGKSSLAFSTLYAEAQRRYLESVSPYARRLFNQMAVPDVDDITGLPPAIALQQQRGTPTARSTVGSVTTISNLLRMLYSRAGDYPKGQQLLYAESFSPNTPQGACPECHGLGRVYTVTERSMVPDDTLTIREKAIAAWPTAWHGQNLREILITLGYDIDVPWKDLPKKDRDWILFTEEQPVVPVYTGWNSRQVKEALKQKIEPSYMGTFTGVKKYVLQTFAGSNSAAMKKRAAQFMLGDTCPVCHGKKLQAASLSVKFAGYDIAELSSLSLAQLLKLIGSRAGGHNKGKKEVAGHPEKTMVINTIGNDLLASLEVLNDLGLGYLSCERSTPTLSPGELQRLRLATQVKSNLFGVVYVMDEPSAGLHLADTAALLRALSKLKDAGNSLFIVEHEPDIIHFADWIVDVGPGAGTNGGEIIFSGTKTAFRDAKNSVTASYLFHTNNRLQSRKRAAKGYLQLRGISRNNLHQLDVDIPLGIMTCVTGVSGSGKSSLVSQALVELLGNSLGQLPEVEEERDILQDEPMDNVGGRIAGGLEQIKRMVLVDQKSIGRTPRSNLATYTGLFDHVRKIFAATKQARARKYDAGRFSFNVAKGRCETCHGEGFVTVELLFLPSVYSPCPTCHGSRYNEKTLEIKYKEKTIADVLHMTVDTAHDFFSDEAAIRQALETLKQVGLGYLRLGQPATELSGGEAQRIKLATELQRKSNGSTIYILDEPTTGLHPADVERLMIQLNHLVDLGNTVLLVEHDMSVVAASDWVIDMGPGAGDKGGKLVAYETPEAFARNTSSITAAYLVAFLKT
ncbi:excinuclease ABC subunit UvrA [Ferruginibacter sp. HRS2-29]|uniref:excinuclease ABC subunit UvrA n=1 Tax=Ferruginibacter sp. HRS2-29 TaxID=2487334 RepID=UPI0020CFC811|nr:excinuclease ABC subunit UvrA [Ferruginibacter sp. HRS2-29]MCP9752983.1 excinuclease ABC subunit A [Ferruginibacter sp. HRS2-29]